MFKEKTYKQIEASRNRRLWITQVGVPVATMGTMVFTSLYNNNLRFRYHVNTTANNIKNFFTKKNDN